MVVALLMPAVISGAIGLTVPVLCIEVVAGAIDFTVVVAGCCLRGFRLERDEDEEDADADVPVDELFCLFDAELFDPRRDVDD